MKTRKVRYPKTNESLNSIIKGINPNPEDKILAILGSGDQAIALAKSSKYIDAIDNDSNQIEYAKDRINLLKEKKFEEFLRGYKGKYPCNFFSEIKKWELNLENLNIIEGDIFKLNWNIYNKMYLSNIINFPYQELDYLERMKRFKQKANELRRGGLIYIITFEQDIKEILSEQKNINSIKINKKLTSDAKDYMKEFNEEGWNPLVFQKV